MDREKHLDVNHLPVQPNVRRNFSLNALDGILFTFGFAFIDPASVLPAFIRRLGGSNFLISVIPAAQTIGWMTPQIFVSNFVERLPRKKPYILAAGIWERLPLLLVIGLCFLLHSSQAGLLLPVGLGAYFATALAFGFVSPAWFDLYAKVTPVRHRGKLSALRVGVGTLLGIAAGCIVERILKGGLSFPRNYGWLFIMAFFFMSLSFVSLVFVREPVHPPRPRKVNLKDYLSSLPRIVREDRNFRNFLAGTFLQRATIVAVAFYAVNGLEKFLLPDRWVGRFTISVMLGRLVATPVFGFLGDRFGHKINLVTGSMAYLAAAILAILAPDPWSYLPVFALVSVGFSSMRVSRLNMAVEFCDPQRRPTYVALSNSLLVPAGFIALAGGLFVKVVGYDGLFVLAGLFALASALCMVLSVREPRKLSHLPPAPGFDARLE